MPYYLTHRKSYNDALGNLVNIDLLEDRATEPSSVLPLPILDGSDEIEWQFSDDNGQGVLSRFYEIMLDLYQGNTIAESILTSPGNYKLRVTAGTINLFEGMLVSFDDERDFETRQINPSTGNWTHVRDNNVRLLFSDSISNESHPTLSQLKALVDSSSNSVHKLDQVPIADLISEFIYKIILKREERFVSAHSIYMRVGSTQTIYNVWMHRLLLNLDSYDTNLPMSELLKSICYGFNLNIGYSHTYNAICAFDNNLLDLGSSPFSDDGEQIVIDLYHPTYLDEVADGIRTEDPTTVEIVNIEMREGLNRRLIKTPRNKRSTSPMTSFITFYGLEDKSIPLFRVGRFNNNTSSATGIDLSDTILPITNGFYGTSGIDSFEPRLQYVLDPGIAGPFDFWSAVQLSNIHFSNRERYKLTIDGYVDPMLPFNLLSHHESSGKVCKAVKGHFNIVSGFTYMETLQIGNLSQGLGNRVPGVNYNDWQYFDPSYLLS